MTKRLWISIAAVCLFVPHARADDPVEITMVTFFREIIDAWRSVADEFEQETGIKVRVQAAPYNGYEMWVRTQFLGKMQPEVLVVEGQMAEQYGRAGLAMKMNALLDEPYAGGPWRERFTTAALSECRDPAGDIWAVPYTSYGIGVFYDRTLYDELGLVAPATWDDWMRNCAAIAETDNTPLAFAIKWTDAQTVWIQQAYLDTLMAQHEATVNRTLETDGRAERVDLAERFIAFELGITDPARQPAFRRVIGMLDESVPYWRPDFLGLDGEQMFRLFASRKCSHTINGTWYMLELRHLLGTLRAADTGLDFEWATFPLPMLEPGVETAPIAGTRARFMVTKQGDDEREQAALEWVRYLSRPDVAQKVWNRSGLYDLPAITGVRGADEAEALRPAGEPPLRLVFIDGNDELSRHEFWVLSQQRLGGMIDADEFLNKLSAAHREALVRLIRGEGDDIDVGFINEALGNDPGTTLEELLTR